MSVRNAFRKPEGENCISPGRKNEFSQNYTPALESLSTFPHSGHSKVEFKYFCKQSRSSQERV
jgi:hypothetical protein